ncbi:hypothetical protein V1508DRAFT_418592 [Lipomyces doorenjongii]|uniref:uncharacterized protein n=1 Tax=Lipomyces doorenjongii TaxID=383834 RepID=UPI0034CE43AE
MPASSATIGHISTSSSLYFIVDRHQSRLRLRRQLEHLHHHMSHHHFKPFSPRSTLFATDPLASAADGAKSTRLRDLRMHQEKVKKDNGVVVPSLQYFKFSFPSPISASIQYRHNLIAASVFPLPLPPNTKDSQRKPAQSGKPLARTAPPLFAQNHTADINARQPHKEVTPQLSTQSGPLGVWQAPPPEDADVREKPDSFTPQSRMPRQRRRPRPKPGEPIWICQFCEFEDIFGVQPVYLMRSYDINARRERKIKAERKRLLEKARMKGKKSRAATSAAVANNANSHANGTAAPDIVPETEELRQMALNTPHDPGDESGPHEIVTDIHARDDDTGTAHPTDRRLPTAAKPLAPEPVKSKKAETQRL